MRETAEKAVELAPDNPESLIAHMAVSLISDWDLPEAFRISERAVALHPNNADVLDTKHCDTRCNVSLKCEEDWFHEVTIFMMTA